MCPRPRAETDDATLDRLLAGDEAAFSELVTAHHASLVRLALAFVSDYGAAEEVVQETWLGVLKGLRSRQGSQRHADGEGVPLMMPPMRMVAMGSLVGHLLSGMILGGAYAWLRLVMQHRTPLGA